MDRWQPTQIANLQEIGSFLQGQREQQNLTLQMVSETTHIRSGVLQSLESGQVNNLPEPVYLRALLKRYGEFLGLQGQAILDRLDDKRPPLAEAPPFQPVQSSPSPAALESNGAFAPPPIVGFPRLSTLKAATGAEDSNSVVLPNAKPVALGGSGGTAPELSTPAPDSVVPLGPASISRANTMTAAPLPPAALPTSPTTEPAPIEPTPATVAGATDRPLPPPIELLSFTPPATSTPWSVMQPLVLGVGAVLGLVLVAWGLPQVLTGRSESDPAGTLDTSSTNSATNSAAPPAATAPPATPAPAVTAQPSPAASANTLPLTLTLSVRGGTSWVQATVDGTVAYEGLLADGSQQSWTAKQSLDLAVGRSDLVWVAINGLPAKVFGDEPNPKQQTFPDPAPNSSN
ncbi:MAG: RodZ domain-containing protein [Prochlorothrix sp.]